MTAGNMYYFEVLHKTLYGPPHLQIGATFPDGSKHYPLEPQFFFSLKGKFIFIGNQLICDQSLSLWCPRKLEIN